MESMAPLAGHAKKKGDMGAEKKLFIDQSSGPKQKYKNIDYAINQQNIILKGNCS